MILYTRIQGLTSSREIQYTRIKELTRSRCKENRLYIEWNLLEKNVKWPFCCTVSILKVYFTYFVLCNLLGPGTYFPSKRGNQRGKSNILEILKISKYGPTFLTPKLNGHKLNILNSYFTVGPINFWRRRPKFEYVACLLD